MATAGVLEKRDKKTYLDDTIPLFATVTTYRTVSSYVEYVVRVQRGPNPEESWEVTHRYSDFDNLHQVLQVSGIPLPLPPKKVFGKNERPFLVERQQGLQTYLEAILKEPSLASLQEVKRFLDPRNYSENFYETALRNVSMFFRSEPNWTVVEPLRRVGWRFRKQYYLIASKTDPRQPRHLLSWCEPGPDFSLGERELEAAMKLLTEIKHPYILSPVSASFSSNGMMIVRRFNTVGSLRDLIYNVKPQGHVLHKYSQPTRGLPLADVRKYGRHVLEALNFLSEKGFVLGHVHAGNVIVDRGCAKLVDLENSLVGLPSLYRHLLLEIRKIYTHSNEVVYSFGHMLYEMSLGRPLKTATMENHPTNTPDAVGPILESILSSQGIKAGIPSLADLLGNLFFSDVSIVTGGEKPSCRISSKLREVLRAHMERAEQRLHEQQRKVAQVRRVSKAHESLMSEDEKKKRRKKMKKQLSLQEAEEPQSYPTTTSLPRQHTIATSQPASSSTSSTASKPKTPANHTTSSKTTAPKAPSAPAPAVAAEPRPPPTSKSSERGALLGAIEGFRKGKLKKAVTNDRSGPLVRR